MRQQFMITQVVLTQSAARVFVRETEIIWFLGKCFFDSRESVNVVLDTLAELYPSEAYQVTEIFTGPAHKMSYE